MSSEPRQVWKRQILHLMSLLLTAGLRIAVIALLACAPLARAQNLAIRSYRVSDGLAHDSVNRIHQDARGFIWIATNEGLSRFDGYGFTNYGAREGLTNTFINDVVSDRRGRLWVATNGSGVARLIDDPAEQRSPEATGERAGVGAKKFVNYLIAEGDAANRVNRILFDAENRLWCVTDEGLYRARSPEAANGEFERVAAGSGPYFRNGVLADSRRRLWFGVDAQIINIVGSEMTSYAPAQETASVYAASELHDINSIIEDEWGRVLATSSVALYEFIEPTGENRRGMWRRLPFALQPSQFVATIFPARDGGLWIGTTVGLVRRRADSQVLYTTTNNLSANHVTALSGDRDGNLWIGTGGGGVCKLADAGSVSYTTAHGLPFPESRFLTEGQDGRIYAYVGSRQGAFVQISDEGVAIIPRSQLGGASCCPTLIMQDARGRWWTYGASRGLEISPGPELRLQNGNRFGAGDGLPENNIHTMHEDAAGRILVVSATGNLYVADATREERPHFQFVSGGVRAWFMAPVGSSGTLWFGDRLSLWRLMNGRLEELHATEGLPAIEPRALFLDSRGRMWIGLRYHGVSMTAEPEAERPRFVNYSTREGLASDAVWAITEDHEGRIYFGTGRGLDQLDPETGRIRHFTAEDGVVGSTVNQLLTDRRGRIWIATNSGVTRFDPRSARREQLPPPVFINHVRIAGEDLPLPETGALTLQPLELEASRNNVSIGFVGLSFQGENSLRYQYQLEGVDADWSAATEGREVNYSRLAPGRYRFTVRAVNSDETVSAQPAMFEFTILRPVYLRWWFVALVALTIGGTVYAFYRLRVRRVLEVANMRTRIATDLHDDIGANLTRIAILSEVAKQKVSDGASESLSAIARISRESVASMSDIVWAISPDRDQLLDLTRKMREHADEIFTRRDIELDFIAPDAKKHLKLGASVRRDFLLIFKEAVNNAARHSNCSRVCVDLRVEGAWLSLAIADDGCGFDTSIESDGQGLTSMRRRAQSLGGEFEIASSNGHGTTVKLRVPFARAPTL